MKAELKSGNLVITIPYSEKGTLSSSNKTFLVASSHGGRPVDVGGKQVTISVNAYVKNPDYVKQAA
jgi:hypothetical protein